MKFGIDFGGKNSKLEWVKFFTSLFEDSKLEWVELEWKIQIEG